MVLVYFRGHGDWLVDDEQGRPVHLIKAEDRGTYVSSGIGLGYHFYRPCDLVKSAFALSEADAKLFNMTGSLSGFKIDRLVPIRQDDSAFTKMVAKGLLSDADFDRCYFKIASNKYKPSRLRSKPELVEKGRLDYDLVLYKPITDEPQSIVQPIDPSYPAILQRKPITRNTEALEVIHAALDAFESKYDKTPTEVETVAYMLSEEFRHSCIVGRTDRELRLIGRKILDKAKIERIYRRTIYPDAAKADIKSQ
ncbi:hypothetical protein ACH50O_00625 [Methylomonas sp. 2BW1-5-20]|uniref:hypothetical protein n=1 Tax=Methylomonas sp. 2BW1-5-20 TaxID=3376686 RepID=UPI0040514FC4